MINSTRYLGTEKKEENFKIVEKRPENKVISFALEFFVKSWLQQKLILIVAQKAFGIRWQF